MQHFILYACQLNVLEMQLWAISENWSDLHSLH